MTTVEERNRRAGLQRRRRMARRRCGNCNEPADQMLDWLGQAIPICCSCRGRLNIGPIPILCAFDEVNPLLLRPPEQELPLEESEVCAPNEQVKNETEGSVVVHWALNKIRGK